MKNRIRNIAAGLVLTVLTSQSAYATGKDKNKIFFGPLESTIDGPSGIIQEVNKEGHRLEKQYALVPGDRLSFKYLETKSYPDAALPDRTLAGLPVKFYLKDSKGRIINFGEDNAITTDEIAKPGIYDIVAHAPHPGKNEESVVGHLTYFGSTLDEESMPVEPSTLDTVMTVYGERPSEPSDYDKRLDDYDHRLERVEDSVSDLERKVQDQKTNLASTNKKVDSLKDLVKTKETNSYLSASLGWNDHLLAGLGAGIESGVVEFGLGLNFHAGTTENKSYPATLIAENEHGYSLQSGSAEIKTFERDIFAQLSLANLPYLGPLSLGTRVGLRRGEEAIAEEITVQHIDRDNEVMSVDTDTNERIDPFNRFYYAYGLGLQIKDFKPVVYLEHARDEWYWSAGVQYTLGGSK